MKKIIYFVLIFECFVELTGCASNPNVSKNDSTDKSSVITEKTYKSKELTASDVNQSFLNDSETEVYEKLGKPNYSHEGEISENLLSDVIDGYKLLYTLNSSSKNEDAQKYKNVYEAGETILKDNENIKMLQYDVTSTEKNENVKSTFLVWIDTSSDKVVYQGDRALINEDGTYADKKHTNNDSKKIDESKNKIYGLDEWWEVPGQWKLKIDSVIPTNERNQFSDKNPQQVVIVTYTYENIGYEKKIQDLYMSPQNIIDSKGIMGETYPATYTHPKPTPIGATMSGAQAAYGIQNEGGNIKITFESYDSDSKNQTAIFEVPVQ